MVYTGKPSRGCQNCRTRRIKCGEEKPACSQCEKSGRECPGYRDEFDLIFRDENVAVARRSKKSNFSKSASKTAKPKHRSISSNNSDLPTDSSLSWPSPRTVAETYLEGPGALQSEPSPEAMDRAYQWFLQRMKVKSSPSPSMEDLATAFFFRNFVLFPHHSDSTRGFLEFIVPIYNETSSDSLVHQATHALAMAIFSNYPAQYHLLKDTRTLYSSTLARLRTALNDPVEVKSDGTLLTVLLASLYEAIMSTNGSMKGWVNHVDGAVSLVKMRGAGEFNTEQSFNLFRAVRSVMLTSSIARHKDIEDFPSPNGWRLVDDLEENAANRLTLISMSLPKIRTKAHTLLGQPKTDSTLASVLELIELAQKVDRDLDDWFRNVPPSWGHRTISVCHNTAAEDIAQAEEWPGPIHTYEDIFIASIVNDHRVGRICCQSVLVAAAAWLAPKAAVTADPMGQAASYQVQQLVDDICASVPFHMKYHYQADALLSNHDQGAAEAMGAYLLVWPLYVCLNVPTLEERQRLWLRGRMTFVGKEFGLNQAQVLLLAQRQVLSSAPDFKPPLVV
ncbi:hypothetical protein M501DRAFT_989255 [Patellaria atrata CBS 101060]|uniref:Zn(2)-C6 fungal-type domain-containing protein n=1 Tax=Patellaria atrata CBS 101060 TaxID=1346257 RepID=A0A9P4S4N1_9PEZI|nr:hypothetical protein M501DRAFT_989255 [Patellaria atrata CBS 101060]